MFYYTMFLGGVIVMALSFDRYYGLSAGYVYGLFGGAFLGLIATAIAEEKAGFIPQPLRMLTNTAILLAVVGVTDIYTGGNLLSGWEGLIWIYTIPVAGVAAVLFFALNVFLTSQYKKSHPNAQ